MTDKERSMRTIWVNRIEYKIKPRKDGFIEAYMVTEMGLDPIIQAKGMEALLKYLNLIEPIRVPMQEIVPMED